MIPSTGKAKRSALPDWNTQLPLRTLILLMFICGLAFCLTPDTLFGQDSFSEDSILPGPAHRPLHGPQSTWANNLPMLGMQAVIATWVFVLGACFGSFLNVVIYRMPAGMSLGKPKSRCPQCETSLAARDNVPVLGWLILRGKCRYCGLPIPVRYPLIEATCGGVFLALLFGELLTGAANLPLRHPDHFHVNPGFWLVWFTKWDLAGIYLFHCALLIIVLATVMIGYDGHRVQRRLTAFGILLPVLAGCMWNDLRPVSAFPWSESVQQMKWGVAWTDSVLNPGGQYWTGVNLTGLLDGAFGTLAGLLAGRLLRWQMSQSRVTSGAMPDSNASLNANPMVSAIAASLVVTGAFLGWQACGSLTLLMLPSLACVKLLSAGDDGHWAYRAAGPLYFVVLLGFILSWKHLNDAAWMIGIDGWKFLSFSRWAEWLMTLVVMFVFASLVRFCTSGSDSPELPEEPIEDV